MAANQLEFPSISQLKERAANARIAESKARQALDRQSARAEQFLIDRECRQTELELSHLANRELLWGQPWGN